MKQLTTIILLSITVACFSQVPRKITFPNQRVSYSTVGNPIFITDIENANQNVTSTMKAILGIGQDTGFVILSGCKYSAGTYSSGLIVMKGVLYSVTAITAGKYARPDTVDIFSKVFSDAVSRHTYRNYKAIQSNTQWGGMPQFTTDSTGMDKYRFNIEYIKKSQNDIKEIAVDIGTWSMTSSDTTATVDISSYNIDSKRIISVNATIITNASVSQVSAYPYTYTGANPTTSFEPIRIFYNNENIFIKASSSWFLGKSEFSGTTYNRGIVIIKYR